MRIIKMIILSQHIETFLTIYEECTLRLHTQVTHTNNTVRVLKKIA